MNDVTLAATKPSLVIGLAAVLLLSGCTTSRYAHAAGQFGALTSEVTADQNARLQDILDDEIETARAKLAAEHARVAFADCAIGLGASPPPSRCRIVQVANGQVEELPVSPRLKNITALNLALGSFAQSLVTLAADSSADEEKFANSLNGLATALGGLNGAVRAAAGASARDSSEQLGAVAGLISELGNLYFRTRRAAVLKRIILESEPLVDDAVSLLKRADSEIDLYQRSVLFDALNAAQVDADRAWSQGNTEEIRRTQDALFAALESYNTPAFSRERYEAIGEAFASLTAAAHADASASELKAAIAQVLQLAATVRETQTAFAPAKGEEQ